MLKKATQVACVLRGPDTNGREGKLAFALGSALATSNFYIHPLAMWLLITSVVGQFLY